MSLAIAAIAALLLAWNWRTLTAGAHADAAYAARLACSCRYVAGRELGDCREELGDTVTGLALSEDAEGQDVTARVLFLVRQRAEFREGQGCALEPWDG